MFHSKESRFANDDMGNCYRDELQKTTQTTILRGTYYYYFTKYTKSPLP